MISRPNIIFLGKKINSFFCRTTVLECHARDNIFFDKETNAGENIDCGNILKWSHLQKVDVSGKILENQQLWEHLKVVWLPKDSSNSNYQGDQEGTSGLSEDNELSGCSTFWIMLIYRCCFPLFLTFEYSTGFWYVFETIYKILIYLIYHILLI